METIVFHSFKGGVGQSLLVVNFALALSKIGKRVVIMDMDFESPGIHTKFGLDEINSGFVDYLMEIKPKERAKLECKKNRLGYISKICVTHPVSNNILIIPAGNPFNEDYWGKILSDRFNKIFYFTEHEISGRKDFKKDFVSLNLKALVNDKLIIKEALEPDYLIVDTKSVNERVAVPLILWSDVVVSMFSFNDEGFFGTAWTYKRLKELELEDPATIQIPIGNQKKKFIPVLCRIPEETKGSSAIESQAKREISKLIQKLKPTKKETNFSENYLDNLFVLSENRSLEANERFLIQDKTDNNFMLTHNYIKLFANIVPLPTSDTPETESIKNWYERLAIDPNIKIKEKYFVRHSHIGKMINPEDQEPNISLRVATLHNMMYSFCKEIFAVMAKDGRSRDEIEACIKRFLFKAGETSGEEFGNILMTPGRHWKHIPEYLDRRLVCWGEFDSSVGFGRFETDLEQKEPIKGRIIVKYNSFINSNKDGKKEVYDLNEFLRGYISGVLTVLLNSSVCIEAVIDKNRSDKDATTFIF